MVHVHRHASCTARSPPISGKPMTDTDFRLLESIAEIPAGSWNSLAGSHPVLRH
jgi:hypothetical protein